MSGFECVVCREPEPCSCSSSAWREGVLGLLERTSRTRLPVVCPWNDRGVDGDRLYRGSRS